MRRFASDLNSPLASNRRTAKDGPPSRRKVLFEAMEPRLLLSASAGVDAAGLLTVTGNFAADTFVLTQSGTSGGGVTIDLSGTGFSGTFLGVKSILLEAGAGNDAITIANSLTLSGDFLIYGNESGAPAATGIPGIDSVTFNGGVSTQGGYLEVFADHITVAAGVALSTLDASDPEGAGDIVFRARSIGTQQLEDLSPVAVTDRNVSIAIGTGATLNAASIYLIAQAEDRSFTELLGTDRLLNTFILEPVADLVAGLAALPVKLALKSSTATISLGADSQLVGSGTVGVYATAKAATAGIAKGFDISIGYAQADAVASITMGTNALVDAGAAAVLISTGTANASLSAEAAANTLPFSAALAVTNANVKSTTTVAAGATVRGNTANVIAVGEIEAESEAESATGTDGVAGFAFALEFTDADIQTRVDGNVRARVGDNSALKVYFNPEETNPLKAGYVDLVNNTINIGPHGLVTEDVIAYDNRRGTSVGGLVDDQSYVVINVADDPLTIGFDESKNLIKLALTEQNAIDGIAVNLTAPIVPADMTNDKTFDADVVDAAEDTITLDNAGGTGTGYDFSLMGLSFELGQPVKYTQGTAPIAGLVDGKTYFVISDLNEFDLQGDNRFVQKQVIQLAETYGEARAGIAIDLGAPTAGATGYKLDAMHVMVPLYGSGAGIIAELAVEDSVSAAAGVEPEDPGVYDSVPVLNGKTLFESILGALTGGAGGFDAAASGAGAGASSFQAAGALALSIGHHNVQTTVGSSADIESNGDIDVKALIDHGTKLRAESTVAPEEGSTDAASGAVSAAVVVGLYDSVAHATIESGADLDALRSTRIISLIEHPYATSPDELYPSTLAEFVDSIQSEGFEALNKYLDGTFGLQSVINSWARATSEAENVGIAGSVTFLKYDNDAKTTVESGAMINQDEDFRDKLLNPHKNNDKSEQVVSVEASNYMELLDIAGTFDLSILSGNIDPWTLEIPTIEMPSLEGGSGGRGGVGGAIFVLLLDNKTHSVVEDGAAIFSGEGGGFNMKADEAVLNIALVQSGADGGKLAIAGSVSYVEQLSDTLANLGAAALITGQSASLYAASLETQVSVAGAVTTGKATGVGVSVAINRVSRDTRAVIGDPNASASSGPIDADTFIDVAGGVDARAIVAGQLWSFSLAATKVSGTPDTPAAPAAGSPTSDVSSGSAKPAQMDSVVGSGASSASSSGLGVSAAISINLVDDNTYASVVGAGHLKAGEALSVTAANTLTHVAVTGGLTLVTGSNSGTALAGAFSLNNLTTDTRAFIIDTNVTATSLEVAAVRAGQLTTVSLGAAGNSSSSGFTGAGSVSINRVINKTQAFLDNVDATVTNADTPADADVTVSAKDTAGIFAFGGGIAISSGGTGFGASIGFNQIAGETSARVRDSSLALDGDLSVSAVNDNTLRSIGISAGITKGNSLAFTLGINLVGNDISAEMIGSELTKASSVSLLASDDSVIQSIGGAVAVGAGGSAIGGSLGWNSVFNNVRARVQNSRLTNVSGAVAITAKSTEADDIFGGKISSAAIAGSVATSGAAVGGALAINGIINNVEASVSLGSSITARGDVAVEALDTSSIKSLTGGAAISTSSAGVGIGLSANFIANTVTASVDASTIDTTAGTGSVLVKADEAGSIDSIAIGLAAGSSAAVAGSVTANVIVNKAAAWVGGASQVLAAGNLRVTARNAAHVGTVAGQLAVSGGASVGAAITNATVINETRAWIDGLATVTADVKPGTASFLDGTGRAVRGVSIEATAPTDIAIFSIGGSIGSTVGVAGSLSITVIDATTEAFVKDVAVGATAGSIASDGDVNILALSDFDLTGASGSIAIGGTAGVGVGADVGVATFRTRAYAGARSNLQADDSVVVQALADEDILSISITGAVGGTAAIGVTAGVSVLSLTTEAWLGLAATVRADANVVVQALDTTDVNVVSGNITAAGGVAIGVAAGIGVINKDTKSWISADAQVTALAADGELAFNANTGTFGAAATVSQLQDAATKKTFTTANVNAAADSITVAGHGFTEKQEIVYGAGAQAVLGLSAGSRYFVHVVDANTIQLRRNADDAASTVNLRASTADNGGPVAASSHELSTVPGVGMQAMEDKQGFDEEEVTKRAGTVIQKADRRGVIVTALSGNKIATAGAAVGVAGTVAVTIAGAVNVHTFNTEAHIDAGADINAVNTGAGAAQGVYVDAGRSVEELAIGIGGSASLGVSVAAGAAVPVVLGHTQAWIGNKTGFATDSHTGSTFGTVVNARGDVEVQAVAQEKTIAVAVGLSVGLASVAGSGAVFVMDTQTLAAISGDVKVDAGGNVLVRATDDTKSWIIAGGVGIGVYGGGAGAVAVTVVTKDTDAIIGGGAVVDADGANSNVMTVPGGDTDAAGKPINAAAGLHGIAVQARSSEDLFALGASVAGGIFVGVAGAVSVEVLDSDTTAQVIGGAELNQNNAAEAAASQSVNVSAVNEVDLLSIDGSVGAGIGGIGASVDVAIVRNDTLAIIGGTNTQVRARDDLDVNALVRRDLSSNTISVAAGGLALAGSVSVYSVGGNFSATYTASDGSTSDSQDALAGDSSNSKNVMTDAQGSSSALTDSVGDDDDTIPGFAAAAVSVANDTITIADHGLRTGDKVVYNGGIAGLSSGGSYYVIQTSATAFKLATNVDNARKGIAIDLTSTGGAAQTLTRGVLASGDVDATTNTITIGNHGYQTGDKVRYTAGATPIGGLTSGQDYYVIKVGDDRFRLATTLANASKELALDITLAGNGSFSGGSEAATGGARSTVESKNVGDQIGTAASATTGISSGTTAAIDVGATIVARDVDLNARNYTRLNLLTGGVGFGAAAGIGLGVVVANVDSDVSAFIAHGTTVNGINADGVAGGDGVLSVDADLNSQIRSLGFAGAVGGFVGLGAAVSVVNDTSSVRALIGERVNNAGAIDAVSTGADIGKTTGFTSVNAVAHATRTLRVATGAAGISAGAGLGVAVTVASVSGPVEAHIGASAEIGSAASKVGSVLLEAESSVQIKPFIDGNPMSIALGGGFLGGAAGVSVVNAGTTAAPLVVNALVGTGASIDATGAVELDATSTYDLAIRADGGAIGVVAIGAMVATSEVVSTTQSSVRGNARINAGSLKASAQNTTDSTVGTVSAAGGIGAGVGTKAYTNVKPTVLASIEGGTTAITTTGDVKVEAVSLRAKAGVQSFSIVIGAGAVGVVLAEADVAPTAYASIGDNASVTAGGRVDVLGRILAQSTASPLDDFFQPAAGDVDTATDTITFDNHGLSDGNPVTYDPDPDGPGALPANTAIQTPGGALQSGGREYTVIVVDANHVKLGSTFLAGSADTGSLFTPGTGVDGVRDVIRFDAQHKLLTGDAVKYDARGNVAVGSLNAATTYFVQKIDEFTIRLHTSLANAQAAAQSVNLGAGSATTIAVTGAGFTNGTRVTYTQPAPVGFTRDLVEQRVNPSITATTPASSYFLDNGVADSLGITAHGFANGDKVVYRTNGTVINGLVNGGTYFVIRDSADIIRLSLTLDGTNIDDDAGGPNIGITPVVISRTVATPDGVNIKHLLERPAIGGLTSGQTYFVVGSSGSTFGLSSSSGGPAIALDRSDRSGTHTIGLAGVDLASSGGRQELHIDLTSTPAGNHRLLGLGGVSLRSINPPAGDGLSYVRTEGGSGGGFSLSLPTAKLEIVNDAQAWIAATLVSAGGDVLVDTQSVSRGDGHITNAGGGAIQAAKVEARVDVTNTSKAYLTGDGVTVRADGQVALKSDSSIYTHVYATADGGGIGAGSDASALTRVDNDSANGHGTLTQLGTDAVIEADTVALNSQVSLLSTYAHTRALAGGLVAVAISNSDIDTDSTVAVRIEPDVRVKATRGIDIGAFHRNTSADRAVLPIPIALIPIPIPKGAQNTALSDLVEAKDGARLSTGPRANIDTPLRRINGTDLDALLAGVGGTYAQLALLVQSDNLNANDVTASSRRIEWDADVVISAGPSPEVLIGADGSIVKAIGAVVTLSAGQAEVGDIGGMPSGGEVLFISNQIANDTPDTGNDFKALFQFADTFGGVTITNLSTRKLLVNNISVGGGGNPFVDLQALGSGNEASLTFDLRRAVSPTAVVVENLNTLAGSAPDVVLKGTIENPIGQTRITALTGDIVAQTARGVPDAGRTTLIRTRDLTLDAPKGTIGYDKDAATVVKNHLAVDIVQGPLVVFDSAHALETGDVVVYHASPAAAALGGLTEGATYYVIRLDDLRIRLADTPEHATDGIALAIDPANLAIGTHSIANAAIGTLAITDGIRLVAQAGSDNFLDIKGRLRDPAAQLGGAGFPNPHVFNLDLVRAGLLTTGGNADVILQSGIRETGTGTAGGVRVRATVGDPVDDTFYNQFRPDLAGGVGLDVGFFGGTLPGTTIQATYNFVNPTGGSGTAGLVANGSEPTSGNIVVTAADSTPTAPRVNVSGITDILGSGHIDVLTNGFVTLTEQAGDMRLGSITSTASDVTLTAPASIVDALADADADATGVNITLKAVAGGIGSAGNFIETNLLDTVNGVAQSGVLRADAPLSIFIEESAGNLRVHHVYSSAGNVSLVARSGSILDGNDDAGAAPDADGRARDAVNVFALDIDLDANGAGNIGADLDDLDVDSRSGGRLYAEAGGSVFVTEVDGALNVLAVRALGGNVRLTVPDTSAADIENLALLTNGAGRTARVGESGDTGVPVSEVTAFATIALWVGDNVASNAGNRVVAGTGITIRGDTRRVGKTNNVDTTEVDDGRGTRMDLRGTIGYSGAPAAVTAPNTTSKTFTQIFGHDDVDTFTFTQTDLDANTRVYGSWKGQGEVLLAHDGEDRFVVDQLGSMHVDAAGIGDTLTLDGQSDTDLYTVFTTGSQGATRNYVVNVLDSGARDNGEDRLAVFGVDGSAAAGATDDIFLLRRVHDLPSEPGADSPAFVALLHGSLLQARDGSGTTTGRSQDVQRVNYDARLNGRLEVYGLGGNDYFAMDDNSAITTLDGGSGADTFQIGQLYGSQRVVDNVPASDTFDLIATTRGYLSRGATMAVVAQGGAGNDTFGVYSNKAELRLEGDDGDDLFVIRGFALAQTDAAGNILKDGAGVAVPLTTREISTAGQMNVVTGAGNNTVQYNINAPVSVDGGAGFDKVVVLGTEFPDNFVITEQGVFGAGVNVRFQNIEVLEIDGLESDDDFYVLGTPVGVITRLIGGKGSDTVNVGGDVGEPIVMQQLEGASGAISHSLTSLDVLYDGLPVDGIDLTVAQGAIGAVVITETGGATVVQEGATTDPLAVDSYGVKLAVAPATGTKVYVTVSASRSQRNEENGTPAGDSMWISKSLPSLFTHTIKVDGVDTLVKDRSVVLVFDSSTWDTAQNVYVYGVDDTRPEGERTVTVNHSVAAVIEAPAAAASAAALAQSATVATFNQAKVRNVEVRIIDNDQAGLVVTQTDGGTLVLEGALPQGIQDSFNLKLAKPLTGTQTVTVNFAVDPAQITLSATSVIFNASNWNTGINVTVTAVDDLVREDFKRSFIEMTTASALADYNGLKSQLAVKVYDNDNPGVLIVESDGSTRVVNDDPTTPGNEAVSDSYTVRLTAAPASDVTFVVANDGQVTTVPTTLTFSADPSAANAWFKPQTVIVTGNPAYVQGSTGIDTTVQKNWAPRPHLLTQLGGPLSVIGGELGERSLNDAIVLPRELNAPLLGFPVGVQPDERDQIDTLNIFDDGSREDKVGTLSSIGLTGFGMAPALAVGSNSFGEPASFPGGITFGDPTTGKSSIEVLNLLMGQGNDRLTITGTMQPADEGAGASRGPARHGNITLVHGGGNLAISAANTAIGGDTITVNTTGAASDGAASPLVIYGDTSQDGLWYSGAAGVAGRSDNLVLGAKLFDQTGDADDFVRSPRANPFDFAGHDVIDASAMFGGVLDAALPTVGLTIYGGAGNDSITGSRAGDHLAGGSGNDTINGGSGNDLIYGDSGFNVDPITRALFVPTFDGGYSLAPPPVKDLMVAGQDTIDGQGGDDIVFGDHGIVTQAAPRGAVYTGFAPAMGSRAPVFGYATGNATNAQFPFTANDRLLTTGLVRQVETTEFANGANDTLRDDAGDDLVLGGKGVDTINAGAGANVVFGDHGRITGVGTTAAVFNAPVGEVPPNADYTFTLTRVESIQPDAALGAGDFITTGIGRDMIFGGQGGDTINAFADPANPGGAAGTAAADGNNIVFGDHGYVDYLKVEIAQNNATLNPQSTRDIDEIGSLFTAFGGNDSIVTGNRNDIVLGGLGNDVLDAGGGANLMFGDSAVLTSDERDRKPGDPPFTWSVHEFLICKITTIGFEDGGDDCIKASDNNDIIFGGTGNDVVFAGGGDDLVFGDQGMVECANDHPLDPETSLRPVCVDLGGFLEFTAIAVNTSTGTGDDVVFGMDGSDVILGQEGKDTLYGGNGDDILIGGSNIAGARDSDDRLDGGGGNDAIAGDNADICFRPDALDVRMRALDGTLIYSVNLGEFDGKALVSTGPLNDPRWQARTAGDKNSGHAEYHIVLLDHVDAGVPGVADAPGDTPANRYGNDDIAGGAGEDELFGQLGNDVIQGDGTVGLAAGLPGCKTDAEKLIDAQLSRTLTNGSVLAITGFTNVGAGRGAFSGLEGIGALTVTASFEGLNDGDDYIEGNGGNDVIFGNRGQDDIIGGSSDLFGFTAIEQRADGGDTIFGGAGTDLGRNQIGEATTGRSAGLPAGAPDDLIVTKAGEHAHDADTIVGDNGRILRLVGIDAKSGTAQRPTTAGDTTVKGIVSSGGFLNYNYDVNGAAAEGYGTDLNTATYDRIVVRAVSHLDYTEGGIDRNPAAASDRGGADEIHGESGDDTIYAQKGNDIVYGEGQDDDIVGGYGNDWISGGTGADGVIGDDGRFIVSRNATGYGEALFGVLALLSDNGDTKTFNGNMMNEVISTPGTIQLATINIGGQLKKAVNLTPLSYDPSFNGTTDEFTSVTKKTVDDQGRPGAHNADDIIFGGLGSDWLHGGSGDDAVLGGEALAVAYTQVYSNTTGALVGVARSDYDRPYNPVDVLRYNPDDPLGWHADRTRRSGEFALYDEYDPLRKITLNPATGAANKTDAGGVEWFLNFATDEGTYVPAGVNPKPVGQTAAGYPQAWDDGTDRIFGDTGNDWLVGGTGRDDMYGGFGNDLMNADDNHATNLLRNDQPDTQVSYEDRAYGGAGRDVLIANTGGDRLIDWVGEFNSYLVPFAPFGMATVSRTLQPQLAEFLYALSASDGADPTRAADTGKDAARNGEPEGELGVVRQKDTAWQTQTGAPADPQAGNIPGGKRDVLRTANFNDPSAVLNFAADSGTWAVSGGTLQVAATSLHADAVSVFQVGDALPTYYEVTARIKAVKPTAGWDANSYIIFDYQSATNFKFAGVDVSTNKLVIGHRNASGWVIDKQSAFPGSVRSDTWYDLLLSVNGVTVTLLVNGGSSFSHTFAPTIIDGFSYGLNWGLVGFGSNNSRGEVDDFAVQIVPPSATVTKTADFASAAGPLFGTAPTGTWSASAGRYGVAALAPADTAISLMNLGSVSQVATTALLDFSTVLKTAGRAGFVFDRYSDTDFKFAAIDVVTKQVLIGHRTASGWTVDAAVTYAALNSTTDYTLGVTVRGSSVSVTLNSQATGGSLAAVGFVFNGIAVDGRFGLFTRGATASFDSVSVKTNDAAVPATQTVGTSDQAGTIETAASAPLDARAAQSLLAEALRRWSLVEDASIMATLGRVELVVEDLAGDELAVYSGGRITVDVDAAGRGWFVDPTPRDDSEFHATGTVLAANANGAAAGRVDLLSVLSHELGHAIGFGHSAASVMDENRLPGERATPERWLAALTSAHAPVVETSAATPLAAAPAAAAQPAVSIDWGGASAASAAAAMPARASGDPLRNSTWQQRFVNHLAATPERLHPNAGMRVHLPIAAPLTHL